MSELILQIIHNAFVRSVVRSRKDIEKLKFYLRESLFEFEKKKSKEKQDISTLVITFTKQYHKSFLLWLKSHLILSTTNC